MRAVTFQGLGRIEVETVPDPKIINPRDAIVQISSTCICGSDLHLYDGFIPSMQHGDILGHEFMGVVVETGRDVRNIQVGDRVITHNVSLEEAPEMYKIFRDKDDACIKVLLKPGMTA